MGDCLEISTLRILLVEDFKAYRSLITTLLGACLDVQVIGEVSDGIEAVEKAQQLRPDVILMDIGLPRLNGLEAARRIGRLVPSSKIVFLTQETATELVHEALSLGAAGYIVKQEARACLLMALTAVLQGKRFVSSGLEGNGFASKNGPVRIS